MQPCVAFLVLSLGISGCMKSCGHETPGRPPISGELKGTDRLATGESVDSGGAEEREAADEARERSKALAALRSYKAETCRAGIAKMEAALRVGKGRWHERDPEGAMPADLLAALVDAEMWRDQSAGLCVSAPEHARFAALRRLMDGIWRYPTTLPRNELEQRLAVLETPQTE